MSRLNIFLENLGNTMVFILTIPLIIYHFIIHAFDLTLIKSGKFKDKLFMKRFNLIDRQHVYDFIKWNNNYRSKRESENE